MKKVVKFNANYFKPDQPTEITKLKKIIELDEIWMSNYRAKQVYYKNDIYIYEISVRKDKSNEFESHKHYEIFKPKIIRTHTTDENGKSKFSKTKNKEAYPFTMEFSNYAYSANNLEEAIIIAEGLEIIINIQSTINEIRIPRFTNIDLKRKKIA